MTTPTNSAPSPISTPLQTLPGNLNLLPLDDSAGGCCGADGCCGG